MVWDCRSKLAFFSNAASINAGSHQTDWRLPTIRELFSLVDFAFSNPPISNAAGTGQGTVGPGNSDPFSNLQPFAYWSSTVADSAGGGDAWAVCFGICSSFFFNFGGVGDMPKSASIHIYLTAVRGGS